MERVALSRGYTAAQFNGCLDVYENLNVWMVQGQKIHILERVPQKKRERRGQWKRRRTRGWRWRTTEETKSPTVNDSTSSLTILYLCTSAECVENTNACDAVRS